MSNVRLTPPAAASSAAIGISGATYRPDSNGVFTIQQEDAVGFILSGWRNADDIATVNGASIAYGAITETITLSTTTLTTDSQGNILPANSFIRAVVHRIKSALVGGQNAEGTITLTGLPSIGVKAQGTITLTGLPVANETFVVGAQTFTWKASRSVAGEVTIGASAAAACTNIIAAITADLATVVATQGTGTTVVVTAASVGTAGNSIIFTEASSNLTIDGSGTLGATTSGVNADTFRIDSQVFTWVTTRGGVGQVTLGASAAAACANIIAAVNADLATVVASQGTGTTVLITAVVEGSAGNSIVFTESSGNLTVNGSGTLSATQSGSLCTGWQSGDATTATRFAGTNSTLTVNTTSVGLNHRQGGISTDATGPIQITAVPLRITAVGGIPDGGVIEVTVFYEQFIPPTS